MFKQFDEFILLYLTSVKGILLIEVDDKGYIENYNSTLNQLISIENIEKSNLLDDYFNINISYEKFLGDIICKEVELSLKKD